MKPQKKHILLVRHGTTDFNERDLLQGRMDNPLDPALPIPGGESFIGIFERVAAGVCHIMKMEQKNILICGHATINRGILGNLLKMNPDAARLFRTRNASLSKIIAYANGEGFRAVVGFWNYSPTLENRQ